MTAVAARRATCSWPSETLHKDTFEIAAVCDVDDVPQWFIAVRAVQGFSAPFVLDECLYWRIHGEVGMFLCTLFHGTRIQFLNIILQSGIAPAGAGELGRVLLCPLRPR